MRSLWVQALIVALGWQLVMTVLGIVLEHKFTNLDPVTLTPLSHMQHWDGGWFTSIIANNAYHTNAAAPVFYPLFPLTVTIIQTLSFHMLSITAAALIVNTLALWLAVVALAYICNHFGIAKHRWLVVALFLTSPVAIFLHFVYAEAIFCALAFWAYLFALRRQWLAMAVALSLLMIVKIPAILVIALCGLEFMRAHQWSPRQIINKNALLFAIVPLGFIGYGWYLQKIGGEFWGMLNGYHHTTEWSYHVFNPNFMLPIIRAFKTSVLLLFDKVGGYYGAALIGSVLPLAGLVLLGLASLYAIIYLRGKALPLGIAGLLSIVFLSINSNLISVHRYVLPCLILYVVPVVIIKRYKQLSWSLYAALFVGCLLQLVLFGFFVSGRFAG